MDLETAVIAAHERWQTKTQQSPSFCPVSAEQSDVLAMRLKLLQTKLDWLSRNWYQKANRNQLRVLWSAKDRPAKEYPQMPPYSLPGLAKGKILNFLADRDAEIGQHF